MPSNGKDLQPIFASPKSINDNVDSALTNGITSQFPIETKNYIIKLIGTHVERKQFTHEDEKKAILTSKSLTYPIRGDLQLISKATGKVVDEQKDFPLMDSFFLTGKHTLLYKGNNYSVANQLQLRPGVYTRSRETGELESHFNTGTGRSFSMTLEPQSGLFYLEVASSKILIAPILSKVFGISAKEVSKYVPAAVWNDNLQAVAGRESKIISDLYVRMTNKRLQVANASEEDKILALRTSLEGSQLSIATTVITLGKPIASVTHEALLLAMKNLVDVHSGARKEDNRDSLQFKSVQNLPDFLETRFKKEKLLTSTLKSRISYAFDKADKSGAKVTIKGSLPSKPFNKVFSSYILASSLVSTPSETNPVESLENVAKVTVLGGLEGGISQERGVPMSARDIDPSHLGIIDPSRTPESSHAGIDQRFTVSAMRDKEGNLYSQVMNKQGKLVALSVHEAMASTIGFPFQEGKKIVQAQIKGELGECPASQVDYWLNDPTNMYTVTTNLVPFLNSNHPGRLTMAGKAIPQALSLVNREEPLVQTTDSRGHPFIKAIGQTITQNSCPVDSVVTKIAGPKVEVKDKDGKTYSFNAVKNLPFNMKGFFDDEKCLYKVGDSVPANHPLFENNYTKNGNLALGKNIETAYIPYKGYNHEDGLVISRTCADSLSSHHAYKIDYSVQPTSMLRKALIARYFPGKFTMEQLNNLDDAGFAKVGTVLHHGDPCYVVLEKREPTPEDKMLGRLHKTLINPYRACTELWHHDENGTVVDSHTDSKDVRLLVRSIKPLEVGDKLTGLHGNKGIVSLILEDHEMPFKKETGKPLDILLNPASVTSRINLGQLMETMAGKIAQKEGKPYKVLNFSKDSNIKELSEELKSKGISDTDTLVDPKTGRELPKVLAGPQYFMKLYKTSDQNWAARNVGGYDNTLQPTKGGEEGSKSVGFMEMMGLLGSDARHNLKEISTLKSEENSEYWSKFLNGHALPKPNTPFATKKFLDYLTASGIKTSIRDEKLTASPLTDKDIMGMSNGVVREPSMLSAKNLEAEKGGLFDNSTTGGTRGTKWTHYALAEPIVNPVFERPVKSLLGLNTNEFNGIASGSIGIKKVGAGIFDLHDIADGKHLRRVNTNG